SARAAVHEYGGGAFTVQDGVVWFVNAVDQAIHRRDANGTIVRITAADAVMRFADLQYDQRRARLLCVAETPRTDMEPQAAIVAVTDNGSVQTIATGHDFYASPRLAPQGDRLVWLAWNHPHMPWDQTELWQAGIDAQGRIGAPVLLHAGERESLFGPFFAPDGRLHVVSDADNWWNIHRQADDGSLQQLTREQAEFGLPQWVFGQKTCTFDANGDLFALSTANGLWRFGRVNGSDGSYVPLALDATHLEQLVATASGLALVMADAATPKRIVRLALDACGAPHTEVLRAGAGLPATAIVSRPEPMAYPTADGDTAHALFYAPASDIATAPADERPPLLIKCHGGPTGATSSALDARIQYWISRGYAVLDVNYRGSTGYGRAYRNKLLGAWGVADVADCVHGVAHLQAEDRID